MVRERMIVKLLLIGFFALGTPLVFAGQVPVGTEVEFLRDINFPSHMTGVWLQNGTATGSDVNGYQAHCMLSDVHPDFYDFETSTNSPIARGEIYRVTDFINNSWVLSSTTGKRELFLDCDQSENAYNRISDRVFNGKLGYVGNTQNPKLKTIKKITRGLLLIKF